MENYILAIDQGTTSSRAVIYNGSFEVIGSGQREFPQHYPQAGWVEHDLNEIWESVLLSVKEAIRTARDKDPHFSERRISAIGITNQRETFGVWNKKNLAPLHNAIVWQCRRSSEICRKLRKGVVGKKLASLTGLVIDPYFSGTKLKWLLDSNATIRKKAKSGEAVFGTIETYLIARMTGGDRHVTEVSNASRTLLMDLKKRKWSDYCLRTLGIPREMLPEILDSDAEFGRTRGFGPLPDGVPIHGVLGDQQAALFGQECYRPGEAKVTFGTGAFLLVNTGATPKKSKNGVSTIAWVCGGKATYAVEGSVFIAGAAVQWFRDGLKMVSSSREIEALAREVPNSDGVFFVPALSGLGAPYWVPEARGCLGGITRGTKRSHIARACLEGVAYSIGDLALSLSMDAGVPIKKLRADGGASKNSLLLQSEADITGYLIERPRDIESTARGAAYIAAIGSGFVKSTKEFLAKNPMEAEFVPEIGKKDRAELLEVWRRRVRAVAEIR